MQAVYIIRLAIGVFTILFLVPFLSLPPLYAQDSGYLEASEKYSREELAQMLAPIALYPDTILSQVLMASTYPIEVIEADRWIVRNPKLKGEALDDALLAQAWEPSVKALCHLPTVLALMSERIAETTNIGNAFLAQEAEVMAMIQKLRATAYAQGNLITTAKQKVIVEKETIIIEPAGLRVIYVPYYDPLYIYGPWWYPAYPPYYWGPPGASMGVSISYWPDFYFGFAFGLWGYFDWHHHYIYINVQKRPRYVRYDRWIPKSGRWNHAPKHRHGVAYRDKFTARKYGQYPGRIRKFRYDTRGFSELRDRDRRLGESTIIDLRRQEQKRIEPERQELRGVERQQQEQVVVEPERKERQGVKRKKREQTIIEPGRKGRQGIKRQQQERVRIELESKERQGVKRQKKEKIRDNIFNRVEEGRSERESSRRGRFSRQGKGGDDRDGREGRGRSRQ